MGGYRLHYFSTVKTASSHITTWRFSCILFAISGLECSNAKSGDCSIKHFTQLAILFLMLLPAVPKTLAANLWSNCVVGGGDVLSIAIDPHNSSLVYVVENYRIYRSTNKGEKWIKAYAVDGDAILGLALDIQSPSTVYSWTHNQLFKSTDRGQTWSSIYNESINALAIDPHDSQLLYAGGDNGVYKSNDGGINWRAVSGVLGGAGIQTFAIDPLNPATLYVGTTNRGVYKSTTRGESWSAVNSEITAANIQHLIIDPQKPETIYAGAQDFTTYKSTNGGESWDPVNTGLMSPSISILAIDPSNSAILYASSGSGIIKSSNGGMNWTITGNGLPSTMIVALAIDAQNPEMLYAGTYAGVYKSINGGMNWSAVNSGIGTGNIRSLAIDPQSPEIIYAGTYGGGLYKSVHGCSGDWVNLGAISSNLASVSIQKLLIDPRNPATVYAGTYAGVYKSTDGGMNWITSGLSDSQITALAINPQNPSMLYAGTYGNGVFKSTDGGMHWGEASSGISSQLIQALAINPQNPSILYAGTVYYSYGMSSGGVYKSTDSGASWRSVSTGISKPFITALAIDPITPTTLYAGTDQGMLFKSSDGGIGWSDAGQGSLVAIDPENPAILYAAYQSAGLLKSTNAAANWTSLGGGGPVSALAIDPANPRRIYVGYHNGGVWTYISGRSSIKLTLDSGGAAWANTIGADGTTQAGYASLEVHAGVAPYGTAVFAFKQDGLTVAEAGVPASTPTTHALAFIDYRAAVNPVPGRGEAGLVDINTGLAIVNNGSSIANVTYMLRDASGALLAIGHGTLNAGTHVSCFIDQLKENGVHDFNLPPDFQTAMQFGSLEIASTQPLFIMALRGTMNQRNEFLMTTTPIADLTQPIGSNSIYFPQFADGEGSTTSLILLNTSNQVETGVLQIRDKEGNPLATNQPGGIADSTINYTIPPGGVFRFQSDGSPVSLKTGWIALTPTNGTRTPVSSGVFGYNPGNVLVSESGIPSVVATGHARIYLDLSGNHNTGIAIANISDASASIAMNAFQKDGITSAGTGEVPLPLPAKGHAAAFADQFISGLPQNFTGVLDISSPIPFAALTIRSLDNERGDFLMTTFPVADSNKAATTPILFPQIADGGGSTTEFILISPGGPADTTLNVYDNAGAAMEILN